MSSKLTKSIIKKMPLLWLLGLLLPFLYLLFFKNLKKPIRLIANKEPYSILLTCFILIQLISVILAIPHDYFSFDRLIAILHNIAAFSFIILGLSFAYFKETSEVINSSLKSLFLFLSLGCIGAFIYSKITHTYIEYHGVLYYLTGVSNDFTNIVVNHQGWIAGMEFPRSRMMGIFPNNTGFLLLVVFILFFATNSFTYRQKLIYGSLFVLATFTTGSRNLILFSVVIFLSQFIQTKRNLIFLMLFVPVLFIGGLLAIEYLSSLRQDSNDTRFLLYWESIKFSWAYNPFFGLGLKPKVVEIAGGDLPIGSHSTLLGYFVKNGILGGLFALFLYLYLLIKAATRIVLDIFQKNPFIQQRFTLNLGMILILLSLLFDDLDSYEVAPLFFGYFFFIFKSNGKQNELH